MALTSGKYVADSTLRVVAWRKPDANGTGEPLWVDIVDDQGRNMGTELVRDKNGDEVKSYPPPEGFKNLLTSTREDSWTYYVNGSVYRQPNGESVVIKPGEAVVFNPDGSVTYLRDEYSQYVWSKAHNGVLDTSDASE